MEIWRTVITSPREIQASSYGRIRTTDYVAKSTRNGVEGTQIKRGKILSPWVNKQGYLTISVKHEQSRVKHSVARLVGMGFCSGFGNGLSINHIDGNKLNNLPENLEWITLAENTKHQWRTGLVDLRGENHPSSILTKEKAASIPSMRQSGRSVKSIAGEFGVSPAAIYKVLRGESWR